MTCSSDRADVQPSVAGPPGATEAIKFLESGAGFIDVVFTDVGFPMGPDGFFLADWIREQYLAIAVAVASGVVSFSAARAGLRKDVAFVEKPYDVGELIALIRALVQDRR